MTAHDSLDADATPRADVADVADDAPDMPVAEPLAEARRLNALATDEGLQARLLGGAAVALSAPDELPAALRRTYKDLDYVVSRAQKARWSALLERHGYVADTQFNALHGSQRLLHYDERNGRQLDTFVATFTMCHSLDLERRLPANTPTLTPVDLLLTKLQIREVNDKDLIDSIALLLFHPVRSGSPSVADSEIDTGRLTAIVRADWGWYTTISDNLAVVAQRLPSTGLDEPSQAAVLRTIEALQAAMESAPKTLAWKARALVGRKLPWYDLPEEVD